MSDARKVGLAAEDRAALYLSEIGFTVLTRRYKSRSGEIDVIALDGEELVFVEVKQSVRPDAEPEARVDEPKRRRLTKAGDEYLAATGFEPKGVRFDLVTIVGDRITHYREAFWPES